MRTVIITICTKSMTSDNAQLDTSQQEGTQEDSETSGIEGSQKTSKTIQEKISTAKSRIKELELLINHWEKL